MIAACALCAQAGAQTWPDKPVKLIVNFPPGGVADLTARPVAAAMEKALRQPVGVVNKTGAAGAVGMQFVATSKPDGYTLLLALSSISIIPEADKLFDRAPAYTMNQLIPIGLISADPTIFVVNASRPWKTVKEFVDDAKKRLGEISYSSSGVYGTLHMAMELLRAKDWLFAAVSHIASDRVWPPPVSRRESPQRTGGSRWTTTD